MSHTLKIAVPRHDIIPGDIHENLIATAANLNKIERDTDLVVLPELFTTGVVSDTSLIDTLAETDEGHTMDDLIRWAAFFGFAIAGSYLSTDGNGHYYNRAFLVEPSGDRYYYNKKHLFSLSTEVDTLTPGDRQSPVIRYRGWNIKMFICYDLRFPVWCRKTDNDFDIMLFPSSWPEARIYQFKRLLCARAIENNAIVIGSNRVGNDSAGTYPEDGSAIFDLMGQETGTRDALGTLYATFDYDSFNRRRERFPTYRDADRFTLL